MSDLTVELGREDVERLVKVEQGFDAMKDHIQILNQNVSIMAKDTANRFEKLEQGRKDDRRFMISVVVSIFGISGTAIGAVGSVLL